MNKKLIKSQKELREFIFNLLKESSFDRHLCQAFGLVTDVHSCWDVNDEGEPINEDGSVIPDPTAENLEYEQYINDLTFPLMVLYTYDKDWDRCGDFKVVLVEFVELKEFQ